MFYYSAIEIYKFVLDIIKLLLHYSFIIKSIIFITVIVLRCTFTIFIPDNFFFNRKKKSEFNGLLTHTSNKKFKTKPIENRTCKPENDDELCITEIIEEIKDALDSELSVQPKDNIHNIPKTVEKVNEPFKVTSPSPKKCEKKIQQNNKISVACPNVQGHTVEKHYKSQRAVTSNISKQKYNKNMPKFKEKNELFKYGNYNR